jgi:hypothetical protein
VALMKQQGTAAQPRRGAENKNGSGAAPRRWLIQIEGDGVEQCCRVGVKGKEQKPAIHHFLGLQCAINKKISGARGGGVAAHSGRLLAPPLDMSHNGYHYLSIGATLTIYEGY